MKAVLLAFFMTISTTLAWAAESPASLPPVSSSVKGKVLEVKDVENYTYLRLGTRDGEVWAAVIKAPVKKGSEVTIENVMTMNNFESKSLKKTFKTILFGSLGVASDADMTAAHAVKTVNLEKISVPKATGANAKTVAEIVTNAAKLKDKPVLVSGKIVKYNPGIMGKNWIHLRDGSGTEANNDILVTSENPAKIGDIVTATGTVRTDKDFGSGYFYNVLIEDAKLKQ